MFDKDYVGDDYDTILMNGNLNEKGLDLLIEKINDCHNEFPEVDLRDWLIVFSEAAVNAGYFQKLPKEEGRVSINDALYRATIRQLNIDVSNVINTSGKSK